MKGTDKTTMKYLNLVFMMGFLRYVIKISPKNWSGIRMIFSRGDDLCSYTSS